MFKVLKVLFVSALVAFAVGCTGAKEKTAGAKDILNDASVYFVRVSEVKREFEQVKVDWDYAPKLLATSNIPYSPIHRASLDASIAEIRTTLMFIDFSSNAETIIVDAASFRQKMKVIMESLESIRGILVMYEDQLNLTPAKKVELQNMYDSMVAANSHVWELQKLPGGVDITEHVQNAFSYAETAGSLFKIYKMVK